MALERTHTVSVRLSPAEHAAWVAAARGDGRGQLGAWVRDRVAGTLPTGGVKARTVIDGGNPSAVAGPMVGAGRVVASAEWAGLRAELGRVGNNLNQAVRVVNMSAVSPGRVVELQRTAEATRVVMAGLLAAVRAVSAGRPLPAVVPGPVAVGGRSFAEQLADGIGEDTARRPAGQPWGPPPVVRRRSRTVRAAAAADRAAGRAAAEAATARTGRAGGQR